MVCRVDITGLEENTTYYYQWYTENGWSEKCKYETKSFGDHKALVIGDIQIGGQPEDSEVQMQNGYTWNSVLAEALSENPDISYLVSPGDNTSTGKTAAEWQTAYDAIRVLNGKVPYSVINGNHDFYDATTASSALVPNAQQLGPTAIDSYFGTDSAYKAQFSGENGGLFDENSVRNTYYKITVGETKWLFINLDFADVTAIMKNAGMAHMGVGRAAGKGKAEEAARMAISSPLLETSIEGAKGVLINVTGSMDIGLEEVETAANLVQEAAHPDANIIFGATWDENFEDEMRVTVIATGFDQASFKSTYAPKAAAAPKADENDLLAEDKPLKPVEAPADIGDIDEIFKIFSR